MSICNKQSCSFTCGVVFGLGLTVTLIMMGVVYTKYGGTVELFDMPSDMRVLDMPFWNFLCSKVNVQTSVPASKQSNCAPWFDLLWTETDPSLLPKRCLITKMVGTSMVRTHLYESFLFYLIAGSRIDLRLNITGSRRECSSSFGVFVFRDWDSFQSWTGNLEGDEDPDCEPEQGCVYTARVNTSAIYNESGQLYGPLGGFTSITTDDYTVVLYGFKPTISQCSQSQPVVIEFNLNRTLYSKPRQYSPIASHQSIQRFQYNPGYYIMNFNLSLSGNLTNPDKNLQDIRLYIACYELSKAGFFVMFGIPAIICVIALLVTVCVHKKQAPIPTGEQKRLLDTEDSVRAGAHQFVPGPNPNHNLVVSS